jgi:hypothetical protein
MWAFIFLVVVFILILFVPAFFAPLPPTIKQPLVVTPDTRTLFINSTETASVNFTVADLNSSSTISATATPTLFYFSNSTQVPSSGNITLTVYGVYTATSFTPAGSGNSVSFQPGGNTLVVDVKSGQKARSGIYSISVALTL